VTTPKTWLLAQIEPWLASTTTLLACARNLKRRHHKKDESLRTDKPKSLATPRGLGSAANRATPSSRRGNISLDFPFHRTRLPPKSLAPKAPIRIEWRCYPRFPLKALEVNDAISICTAPGHGFCSSAMSKLPLSICHSETWASVPIRPLIRFWVPTLRGTMREQ